MGQSEFQEFRQAPGFVVPRRQALGILNAPVVRSQRLSYNTSGWASLSSFSLRAA